MSEYQPGLTHRATCPQCDQRCRVRVPKGGIARVCCWHRSRARDVAFHIAEKRCDGTGEICREDRIATEPEP